MSLLGLPVDPFSEFRNLTRQMDNLLRGPEFTVGTPLLTGGDVSGAGMGGDISSLAEWRPHIDIKDRDKSLIIHAELPGVNKEDIKLSVENNRLILQGEKKVKKEEEKENFVRKEIVRGRFYRSFLLPPGVDASKVKADYNNGVLEVIVTKPEEGKKGHEIQIGTGVGQQHKLGFGEEKGTDFKLGDKDQKVSDISGTSGMTGTTTGTTGLGGMGTTGTTGLPGMSGTTTGTTSGLGTTKNI